MIKFTKDHPIKLTLEDWTEIFYALADKQERLPKTEKRWIKHLDKIMDKIGLDGESAASSGVEANG